MSSSIKQSRFFPWLKLLVGTILLGLLVLVLFSGYTPPGILGEVVRHNQEADVDTSPFFYGDVEKMTEIFEEAEQMHRDALLQDVNTTQTKATAD